MLCKDKFIICLFVCFNLSLSSQILFEDEASIRGITSLVSSDGNGTGISFADFDNDGWDDITIPSGNGENLKFFKNFDGFYVEQELLRPPVSYRTRSVSWVDYDNDGDRDLFVVSDTNGNRLFRKEDDGSFVNVTTTSGLFEDNIFTYSVSWGDIDNDGCLDLFLSNRTNNSLISNYLFKNNCDGTFSDVTNSAGISSDARLTFGVGFFDYNNDGFQDIYVINDKNSANRMYKNNGDSTFSDVSTETSTGIIIDAMSVSIDDYNSDGFLDIYITNTQNDIESPTLGSVLLKNVNGVEFEDVSAETGTQLDGWCWGANFLDAENDSDLDLYVSCIFVEPPGTDSYGFYENDSSSNYSQPSNIGFLNNDLESFGSASGDSNNDGKTDLLVINNGNILPNLWINKTSTTNNYLAINLEGIISNKDAVGSKIEISINGNKQYRYIMNGESYISQNSFKEIFGLGSSTIVDYVKVTWLSGIIDTLFNVNANQIISIQEGNTLSFDDFENQKLFQYYPNPVTNKLILNAKTSIDSVTVYNLLGQIVMKISPNKVNAELNMINLIPGAYFVKVNIANITKTVQVLKN